MAIVLKEGDKKMNDILKVVTGYRFLSRIMKFSWPVRSWVLLLIAVNVSSLFFLQYLEAQFILGVFVLGAMFMLAVEYKLGFVRLLGLGHAGWLFLLPWLYFRLDQLPADDMFRQWIMILIAINSVSLVIDIVDVIRYLRGERAPLNQ